jgi:thiol-disulfide isomerase/thioredoxin
MLLWVAAAVVLAAVIAIGLADRGSVQPGSSPDEGVRSPAEDQRSTAGVPDPIRANLRDANRIVDGSLQDRLASLGGVPVVVNQWASWCGPCRAEFPFFQSLAGRYRERVAFLGLNSRDERAAAERFLAEFPVPYPSVSDDDAAQARSVGAGTSWPTTIFYDADGDVRFVRIGGYADADALDADIRAHALRSG